MSVTAQKLPVDRRRGAYGMGLFIATEASLFAVLFFAYYFLSAQNVDWPLGEAPSLKLSLPMTGILILSSIVLYWGEKGSEKGNNTRATIGIAITLLLGAAFITLQVFEYLNHLKHLKPTSNAYGSIFYTITSLHGLHLVTGMLFLIYVLMLPKRGEARRPPYEPLHYASLYWHFVDTVWLFIITLLYIIPNIRL